MATNPSDIYKTPPHDLQAEKSVLGAILIDSGAIGLVAEFLRSTHFYQHEHQLIYAAMLKLFEKQIPIDIITIKNQLQSDGELKNAGGKEYLSDVVSSVPTSAYIEQYGLIIKGLYTKRRLIEVASRSVEKAFENTGEIRELIDEVESEVFSLAQEHQHKDFIPLKEIVYQRFEELEEFRKTGAQTRGIPTGFTPLDNKLSGFLPSNLVILAARPGVGKTSFSLNIALHVALNEKKGVGFFSLEMSKEELVDRLLVGQADIDAWRLKTGKLSDDDTRSLMKAMGDLAEAPIYIDDTPGISILEMRTKARKLKAELGLDLIVVDYLQLANAGKKFESRVQEVSYISQGLKNLARELKIPVLALSQLSRAVEQRGDKKPVLADLRESGAIEQDADVVMFIYREDDGDDLLNTSQRMMKIDIAKHRSGSTGEIDLVFRGDRIRFTAVDKIHTL
ncbi:MAG TPA: replicative DNA helicase [Candidatus Woesebacteria bacterium]|nr:replicative DNA helicase [Candidatus Woesebacteria bacterium]